MVNCSNLIDRSIELHWEWTQYNWFQIREKKKLEVVEWKETHDEMKWFFLKKFFGSFVFEWMNELKLFLKCLCFLISFMEDFNFNFFHWLVFVFLYWPFNDDCHYYGWWIVIQVTILFREHDFSCDHNMLALYSHVRIVVKKYTFYHKS